MVAGRFTLFSLSPFPFFPLIWESERVGQLDAKISAVSPLVEYVKAIKIIKWYEFKRLQGFSMHNLSAHSQCRSRWTWLHTHRIQSQHTHTHVMWSSTYCLIAILWLLHEFYCKHSRRDLSVNESERERWECAHITEKLAHLMPPLSCYAFFSHSHRSPREIYSLRHGIHSGSFGKRANGS